VIHLHMAYGSSILEKALLARLAKKKGVSAIVHLHGSQADVEIPSWSSSRRRWLERSFGAPHIIVALTDRMKRIVMKAIPSVRVEVLPNAVDLVSPPPALELAPPCLGFIGFLDGRKGEMDLIEALSSMGDLEWQAQIAGDGSNMEAACNKASQLGLKDRIRFLGFVSGDHKEEFFAASTSFVCLPKPRTCRYRSSKGWRLADRWLHRRLGASPSW